MTPQMDIALAAPRVMLVGLLEIVLPSRTVRLCDGSAVVQWGDKVFTGRDDVFGTIGDIEEVTEEAGDTMPGLDVTLLPPKLASAIELCSPDMQGSSVRGWLAAIDPESGQVVPDPELLFAGEVDLPVLEVDRGTRAVTFQIASVFERLVEPDEGVRLADSFHQYVWPGELGLANMTGAGIDRLWGPGDKPPAFTPVPQGPSAPGGGGGGGYDYRGYEQAV
ncbi:MAG: hypothetical protein FJ335_11240 [Sphingomonadales bacterium]|nr:hypothetical protein [Sphingomonadales bacterium]